MTSSSTRSSARAESGRSESRPGVSPRESISEKKATALNAVAFFVDLPPLLQRRIESAAERCCGRDRCHSGGFLLRIMPPSWHPAPACAPRLRCRRAILSCSIKVAASIPKSELEIKNRCSYKNRRRNRSPLRQRRIESDADLVAATTTAGETILLRGNEIRIGRGSRCR